MDLYDREDGTLYDWKETSVWKLMVGDHDEWTQQGNINRLICIKNDLPVSSIKNIALFRDWKMREAKFKSDYPQCAIQCVELPLWTNSDTVDFIRGRIASHVAAQTRLPDCSPTEMWERPQVFAVHKKGQKRAVKLYDTDAMANAHVASDPGRLEVQLRPGSRPRCENYCIVAPWCEQFQNWRSQQGAEVNQQQTQTDLL